MRQEFVIYVDYAEVTKDEIQSQIVDELGISNEEVDSIIDEVWQSCQKFAQQITYNITCGIESDPHEFILDFEADLDDCEIELARVNGETDFEDFLV